MKPDTFLGTWALIPELCIYEEGVAPKSGIYEIKERNNQVEISVNWTDSEGQAHAIEFGGAADGSDLPADAPGVTHMTLTRIDEHTLDSAAFNQDAQIMYARRVANDSLLTTWQRIDVPGGQNSIFQVYRRLS